MSKPNIIKLSAVLIDLHWAIIIGIDLMQNPFLEDVKI